MNFTHNERSIRSRGSSVSVVSCEMDDRGSIPGRGCVLFFSAPAVGPTQPPIQWAPGVLSAWTWPFFLI